ncbi:DUF1254 domain-containing protein [Rhizobium grahamii]|uniref:DUF1254 domain-containing protein n=1 Tax=Rhizobium grahamii TaxID=1120045 RepID=A0A5Q0C4P0_9HYPH|nr:MULTISPECIES: DUF1214 domain-containing protein [Rhizobium]QFY60846.1 DUF1254 domain-containing protein [Rhizobium grahamii]QRM50007.1 DUF1254 domain-containing protein [Rhizobium sp. BG6]
MRVQKTLLASLLLIAGAAAAADAIKVTPDNFVRAETDMYFTVSAKEAGLGKLFHRRDPFDVAHQTVVRGNRDTLYSSGVFDLDAGPVTITMPDAGNRFMSLMVVNEDHYVTGVFHGAGSHTLTRDGVGTRYVLAAVRTLIDPGKAGDSDEVHKLQDAVKVDQPGGPGKLELPVWDKASQDTVRSALLELASTMSGFNRAFGSKEQVDPVHHLIGAAAGWGGNPDSEATYIAFTPSKNDGKTVYTLHVPSSVPVDGFWSISRYNAKGFFTPNKQNAYSINNLTATKAGDGSIDVQFGDCDGKVQNCLPIEPGWNYTVRLYRPQPQVLDGSWKFPDPQLR